jgi:pantoate--beta-alanine ligase
MKIIKSIEEMREYSLQLKQAGKIIGLIDTEGELHDGHMSLVKIAKENVDVVVLNILHTIDYFECFPEEYETQLKIYEQDFLEKDVGLCKLNNVDVLFLPSMDDLFLDISDIHLNMLPPNVQDFLYSLPIHTKFILAAKELYSIISPDMTVLGQKDIYLAFIFKSLIKQLDLPIKVIVAPIIRDSDGLASSSRNRFLSKSERQDATSVYQVLHEISRWSSYPPIEKIKEHITNRINMHNGKVNFIDICCVETLEELDSINKKFIIIVDTRFGAVDNLGDNIIIAP